ncbi:MAG: mechanosensitive ion channel family protein [Tannerella sp.]|jgi:small-conductance mechanosensitive channel|nr:mechanosensitive ion channel family protein [Tannerella sp.]
MKKKFLYLITLLSFGWMQHVCGQTDTIKVESDSVYAENTAATDLIQRAYDENMTSSLKKAMLAEQLEAQHTDKARREELEAQLRHFREDDSIRHAAMQIQIDSLKRYAVGAPVVIGNDTVMRIYTKFGAFMPDERAEVAARKILQTARLFSPKSDSLVIMNMGSTHDIMYRETTLMSISDFDAMWTGQSRVELATERRDAILASIQAYRKATSVGNTLKRVALSILVVLILCVLIAGVNYLFIKIIDRKVAERKSKYLKGIRIRNLEIINSEKQIQTILFLSKIARYLLYAVLLYLALPLLFSIFPVTQRLAHTLLEWILTPVTGILTGFVNYLPNLLRIVVIVIIIRYLIKFMRYVMREIELGRMTIQGFYPDWARATFNIIRIFLLAFAVILIFPLLPNSDSKIFQGVSMFLGLVVSLGSTSIVGNLVAGLVITYMRPFKIGDRIKVGEVFGDIIEKSPFVIRVKTIKKEIITVPNLAILSSNVINYSTSALDEGVILYTTVTMGYEVPQQKVYALLITAALKTTHILAEPVPFVLSLGLGDNSASYQINAYTRHPERQAVIYSEMHRNILDTFHEAGIEMIIPHYRAVRDGNKSTIPAGE